MLTVRYDEIVKRDGQRVPPRRHETHEEKLNSSTALAEFLAAVVADDAEAVRLVRAAPAITLARVADERLVEEIAHQLYVGDTALHLAAAALRPLAIGALIEVRSRLERGESAGSDRSSRRPPADVTRILVDTTK